MLTIEELTVVIDYLDRKIWKLEDSNLKDSYCYSKLYFARQKLIKMKEDLESESE